MGLESDIKQKEFKSQFQKLAVNILYTNGWLLNIHSKLFKEYGISVQQFNILRILRGQYPNSSNVGILVERMLDKSSNVTRLLDKLVLKELVTRTSCENDRRKFNILITTSGLELLSILDEKANQLETYLKNLSEEEALILNNLLDKLRG
jgi:DNA-binding MarR family transcriptional regulator